MGGDRKRAVALDRAHLLEPKVECGTRKTKKLAECLTPR